MPRGHRLLTAGECQVIGSILALPDTSAAAWARLVLRKPTTFVIARLADADATAVPDLYAHGLVDHLVPWTRRVDLMTNPLLGRACRLLGLPAGGRRADRVARLVDAGLTTDPAVGRRVAEHLQLRATDVIRVRHRSLVQRLLRWASLRARPDPRRPTLERLDIVRWPAYTVTGCGPLHRDRRALLRWEQILASLDAGTLDTWLVALADPRIRAPAGLDLTGPVVRRATHAARDLERAGDTAAARSAYERLVDLGAVPEGTLAVRIARTLEAEGAHREALAHLRAHRARAVPRARIEIGRTGRRIARAMGGSWAPDPPLRTPMSRRLRLARGTPDGPRPTWLGPRGPAAVESVVIDMLEATGRRALHGEGSLWRTLFALLFAERAYFAPVPGALPAPRMAGPVDLGTPAFASSRPAEIAACRDTIVSGRAAACIRSAHARFFGTRLAGANWSLAPVDWLADAADGLGPTVLACVMNHLLDHGLGAAAGLPDLVVLPGDPGRIHAFPAVIPGKTLMIEVKGPGDVLRLEQRLWCDRLLHAGAAVEIWRIRSQDD